MLSLKVPFRRELLTLLLVNSWSCYPLSFWALLFQSAIYWMTCNGWPISIYYAISWWWFSNFSSRVVVASIRYSSVTCWPCMGQRRCCLVHYAFANTRLDSIIASGSRVVMLRNLRALETGWLRSIWHQLLWSSSHFFDMTTHRNVIESAFPKLMIICSLKSIKPQLVFPINLVN